jgi:hypothetical protein
VVLALVHCVAGCFTLPTYQHSTGGFRTVPTIQRRTPNNDCCAHFFFLLDAFSVSAGSMAYFAHVFLGELLLPSPTSNNMRVPERALRRARAFSALGVTTLFMAYA